MQSLKQSHIDNGEQWKKFDQDITDTIRIADAYVDDRKRALRATADKEKSLRSECEKIVKENNRLLGIQSENVAIHRQVTNRLDNDLKPIITDRNELDHQLIESKLQSRLDREEFERLLLLANQHKVAVQKEEENKSFSHQEAQKFHNPTGHHMANSTELPGHDNIHTMMSKVKH